MMNEIIVCKNCCTWIIVCKYNCCTFKKFALAWLGAESKHWQSWMILQAYIFSLALPHEWSPVKVPQVVPQMMRHDCSSRLNLKEASRSVHQWTTIADYSCWKASNPDWLTAKSHQKWQAHTSTYTEEAESSHRNQPPSPSSFSKPPSAFWWLSVSILWLFLWLFCRLGSCFLLLLWLFCRLGICFLLLLWLFCRLGICFLLLLWQ